MAVHQVLYVRSFVSETEQVDVSYHGSPSYEPKQSTSEKDNTIRKDAVVQFSHSLSGSGHPHSRRDIGFDGSQFYEFSFYGGPKTKSENREENVAYEGKVDIVKAGDLERLATPCDLELFLLRHDYIRKDSK